MTGSDFAKASSKPGLLRPGAFGFLGSLELALALVILLALACLAGALIPQNQAPQLYLEKFGPRWWAYFTALGFTDLFYSLWFRGLLLVFGFNLLFCTLERLPRAFKKAAPFRPDQIRPRQLGPHQWQAELEPPPGLDPAAWRGRVIGLAAQAAGPLKEKRAAWGRLYWADRGRFSPLGPYLIHLSLLLFLAAALVGQIWGYSGFLTLAEGESSPLVEGRRPARGLRLPFEIALDKFHLDLHPADPGGRTVDEYRSQVVIAEPGGRVRRAEIKVNHPLTHQGIIFYQSSYSRFGGVIHLEAQGPENRQVHLDMRPGQAQVLPDGSEVKALDFKPSLMKVGPAALLEIKAAGRPALEEWVFKTRPSFVAPPAGPWAFAITGFTPGYQSTFQVVKAPEAPLVWLAASVMLAGFALTYLNTRKRFMLLEISGLNGGRSRFVAAAYAARNQKLMVEKGRRLAEAANSIREV